MLQKLRGALERRLERDSDLSFVEYHALTRLSEEPDRRLRMSERTVLTHAGTALMPLWMSSS